MRMGDAPQRRTRRDTREVVPRGTRRRVARLVRHHRGVRPHAGQGPGRQPSLGATARLPVAVAPATRARFASGLDRPFLCAPLAPPAAARSGAETGSKGGGSARRPQAEHAFRREGIPTPVTSTIPSSASST